MAYPVALVENSPIILSRQDTDIDGDTVKGFGAKQFGEYATTGCAEQCFAYCTLSTAVDDTAVGARFEESEDGATSWTTVEGTEIPVANHISLQWESFIIGLKAEQLTKRYFRLTLVGSGDDDNQGVISMIIGGSPSTGPVVTAGALATGTTYQSALRYVIK